MPFLFEINAEISRIISLFANAIINISTDRRDEWPANKESYVKGSILNSGEFGTVKLAELRHPLSEVDGIETRRCVIKTVYLKRRLEKIFGIFNTSIDSDNLQNKTQDEKIFRLIRRTIMDLYILNRCRHENIMHSHAVFLTSGDLHIVLPHFYVLEHLIEMFRTKHNSEPISALIIAKIIRQVCHALYFFQELKIMHRDVQSENIYLTRNGTVKLAHFGQSKITAEATTGNDCRTPVGKETFMSAEKLHNLHFASTIEECKPYSYASDVWSLGVLVLRMVSYFPEESFHRLPKDFALIMHNEHMPFQWLTVNMVQLRSRLSRSGGEALKSFLSQRLLTVDPEARETVESLPKCPEMRKWCYSDVEDDKKFIRKKFIDDLDFANQNKIEPSGPNYDHLETKDIPPKFYWDGTWKEIEAREFIVNLSGPLHKHQTEAGETFTLSNSQSLLKALHSFITKDIIEWVDLIPLDFQIREMCYELVDMEKNPSNQLSAKDLKLENEAKLAGFSRKTDETLIITVNLLVKNRLESTSSCEYSDDEN